MVLPPGLLSSAMLPLELMFSWSKLQRARIVVRSRFVPRVAMAGGFTQAPGARVGPTLERVEFPAFPDRKCV